jgi:outer membrane lipoprotein-sorting protein
MKKAYMVILASIILLCPSWIPAQDDPAQKAAEGRKILEKWITAIGGRERLSKIADTTATSDLNLLSLGVTATRITYIKGFSKIRLDTKVMGMNSVLAYDGKTGWMNNPQTGFATDMPEPVTAELKKAAIGNDALLNPETYGITIASEGHKSIGGKEYVVLKQTYKDGDATTVYLDPVTYLSYRSVSTSLDEKLEKVEQEITMSDYREVDGIKVPFMARVTQRGTDYATVTIKEYKFNTGLSDSLFERPAN